MASFQMIQSCTSSSETRMSLLIFSSLGRLRNQTKLLQKGLHGHALNKQREQYDAKSHHLQQLATTAKTFWQAKHQCKCNRTAQTTPIQQMQPAYRNLFCKSV